METNNQKNDQNIIPNDADKQQKGVNVPNLRFPNYNSAWQKNKFGNLLTLLKNNTLSRAELNYENGKIKDIHYGDVLIKFNDFVLSDSKIIPYINDDRIPHNYADLLLKTGDLVIADTAEDYTVGKATELIFNDQSLIISGLHTIPCRPINNIFGSKYLGYYINSPSFHNQLLPLIQGIKVSSISKSQIIDTFISYPKINEQCKITEFLTLIDQRIDTQSKIIEQYESLIKVINQMMCNFDHEKIQVQNVFDFKEKTKHQANMGNSQGNFIYFTNEESTCKYFDSYDFDGEYIIANTGGKANFKYYNGKFAVMSDCLVMECNDNQNTKFYLYSILNRIDYINQVCFVGSGLKHLDKKLFLKTSITKFNKNLEPFINLMILLEKKISNDKILLQKLKEQKKYLLSNMFI